MYTTHAEVFQDFANLQAIELVDPHAWYYTNQQDPRYKIPAVIEQLKAHGMTALSETQDLTLDISQKILERAM